ncbi:MAG TPA: DUF3375 domain-containing protein [Actinomycetales bacterium]|nr:DUF3375 domain-containing protein [Actinomycetales bacterium]
MDYDDLDLVVRQHPAFRLLRADNVAMALSFLDEVFVEGNVRTIAGAELASRLDDHLYALNQRLDEAYPRRAQDYLDDWVKAQWLRKYYPVGSDEVRFDATPAVEKAVAWIKSLENRAFVGTESRLNTVFELLRQMVFGAETDPDVRLAELRRRRAEVDEEIAKVLAGEVDVMDPAAQRDRYQQLTSTARDLLADFREVESNFRALDRELRERIASWDGSKGQLLDEVLGDRYSITESDQGRSFHAFYDFLLSSARQAEFTDLLERVHALDAVGQVDPRMRHIHYDWLDAGERTQATVRLLSEQLRRFLDDQVWLENRRVVEILRSIEADAIAVRDADPRITTEIDDTSVTVVLPMERPLYAPRAASSVDSTNVEAGESDFDATLIFEQVHVDPARLAESVRRSLQQRNQITLPEVVDAFPLEEGLAELVTYLNLDDPSFDVVFDDSVFEHVSWTDQSGHRRAARVPGVTFARTASASGGTR